MPEDLPIWAFLLSHVATVLGGGGLGAWMAGRGASKEGDAALSEARTKADSALWSRMEAEIERLDRRLEQEREECDERIGALEDELDETQATVDMLVHRLEDISDPWIEDVEV